MAVTMEDRPFPPRRPPHLTLRPLTVQTGYGSGPGPDPAAFVDTPMWSAAPMSGFPRLSPLLPDSGDEERVSEIDQQALRNLRSFQSQPGNYSPGDGFAHTLSLSPSSAGGYYERRHTLASPTTPFHPSFNSPLSPTAVDQFGRRRSAPFASRRASAVEGTVIVVARQLPRPSLPIMVAPDVEVWWPIQPNGEVKVHVSIINRRGQAERLTRCFPPARLKQAGRSPSPPQTPFRGSIDAGQNQNIMPGRILPIPGLPTPGDTPQGRRSSAGWSPMSLTSPRARRGSHQFEFPGQLINRELAVRHLSLLGAIITQTKRPIHGAEEILMPMPYPSAWPETIQYIHTGNRECLSETVKSNLVHLGGRF